MSLTQRFFKNAPRVLLGAFFLCLSCKEEIRPSPPAPTESEPLETPAETPTAPEPEQAAEMSAPREPETSAPEKPPSQGGIRFMAYNIENYLTMDRYMKGGQKVSSSKDPKEIAALVKIIVAEKPDILGICEIGTPDDLADLQGHLKAAGLDLPHVIHAGGIDATRRLGLLSALPITANNSKSELVYNIDGHERQMGRGILSAIIDLPGGPTHFVGLHLKSKREMKEFDQAEIRLREAILARKHCDDIFDQNPNARIVVYGDMNDTRKTPALQTLMGPFRSDRYIGDVYAKDSRGDVWTQYWSYQQVYSRLDWVLTSKALTPEVDIEQSYVPDPPNWNEASDHRPVLVTFKK